LRLQVDNARRDGIAFEDCEFNAEATTTKKKRRKADGRS